MSNFEEKYCVNKIDNAFANNWQSRRHYKKTKSVAHISFGLFKKVKIFEMLIGVCIYGTPTNFQLCKSLCGEEEKNNILELNRLFITDNTPKNMESWFIARTFKKLKQITHKDIIVSYSDSSVNHKGIIYQAMSFIYTGVTMKTSYLTAKVNGKILHQRSMPSLSEDKLKQIYGSENIIRKNRTKKYRYVKFIGSKTRKKKLRRLLKYKSLPYEK